MNKVSEISKQFYLQERELLSAIANDEAVVSKRSACSVVEQCLVSGMLPRNPKMNQIARELYAGSAPDLPFAFGMLFDAFALRADGAGEYLRPFIEYYHFLSLGVDTPVPEQSELLVSHMEAMCNRLHECADDSEAHGEELRKEALELQSFIVRIESGAACLMLTQILCILISSWNFLCHMPDTYSFLSYLSGMQTGIRNDADARYGFLKKLKEFPAGIEI
jgi:hypothetical protein